MIKHPFLSNAWAILLLVALGAACSPSAPVATPAKQVPPTATLGPVSATTSIPATATSGVVGATTKPSNTATMPKPTEMAKADVRPIKWPERAGLDRLTGYHVTLRTSFKGTRDGQAVETSTTYTRSYRKSLPAQVTVAEVTGADGKPMKTLFGYVGTVAFQQAAADKPCTASAKASDLREWNPGAALRPVSQGKLVGAETVNGLRTVHYALDASSLGKNWPAETSGDLYLADPDGYVVKYVLRLKAGESFLGKGNQGEQTTAFELLSVGDQVSVMLPAGCPGSADLPAMADATDLARTPWGLTFLTGSSTTQVIAAFREQMKARGWEVQSTSEDVAAAVMGFAQLGGADPAQVTPTAVPSTEGGWILLTHAKERQVLYITLKPEGGKVRVSALVNSETTAQ